MKNTVEQLVDIYFRDEWWHSFKMPYPEAINYHYQMLMQGNIKTIEDLGIVLGYYEVWLINKEQLNRIILHKPFDARKEDVSSGDIAYLSNLWIDKSFRKGRVFRELYAKFFEQVNKCQMVVGEEQPRKGRLRVFKNTKTEQGKWDKTKVQL